MSEPALLQMGIRKRSSENSDNDAESSDLKRGATTQGDKPSWLPKKEATIIEWYASIPVSQIYVVMMYGMRPTPTSGINHVLWQFFGV